MTENNGIFTNKDEVVEGMRKAAEAVGADPDKVAPSEENNKHLFAKKSCKHCFGRGVLTFVPSPQKQKVFSANFSERGYRAKKRPSPPRTRVFFGVSPANEELNELWDDREVQERPKGKKMWSTPSRGTSRPEPDYYKGEAEQKVFCRCVKTQENI